MTAKALKITLVGTMMVGMVVLSCGRHETSPNVSDAVGSIHIILTPGQLRLPSPEAVDSSLITVLVLDSKGVGLPDIKVNLTRNPEIGHITQPDSTDSLGQTSAWFVADPGVYDTIRISAGAGGKTASALLTISESVSEIGSIVVTLQKEQVVAGGVDSSLINVMVLDTTGSPIRDGTAIYFSHTGSGFLMSSRLATVNGQVLNRITSPVSIPLHPGPDSIFVSDSPGDTAVVADTAVIRYLPGQISHLEFVYPESSRIMFTHTDDTCSVLLSVTDANGNPIFIDTPMTFDHTLPYSTLTPQPPDTIYGYVRNIYQVGEGTGDDNVTAWIVGPQNPNDTIRTLQPVIFRCLASEPSTLLLDAARDNIIVGGDSTNITATLLYTNGDTVYGGPIPEDYQIEFVCSSGCSFNRDYTINHITVMTNVSGQAITRIYSGTRSGPVTIDACTVSQPPDSLHICNTEPLAVTIFPGIISQINFIYPESPRIMVPGSGDTCSVIALAADTYGNPLRYGGGIWFRNNPLMGTLGPARIDTANGFVTSLYTAGNRSGIDNVYARALHPNNPNDTITTPHPIIFNYGSLPSPMLILSTDNPRIHVGGESTHVIATLLDGYGNPLSDGYYVAFDITAGPMDSLGRRPSFDPIFPIQHDTAITDINGQAIVQLYSGIKSGMVSVRACTVPLPPDSLNVCDAQPLVRILAGPLRYMNITFSFLGEAIDSILTERFCRVGIIAGDRYSNPVDSGALVYLALIPDSLGWFDPNYIIIGADSIPGIGYTRFYYQCYNTFQPVQVIASAASDSGIIVDTSGMFPLPIYHGDIQMILNPDSLWVPDSTCASADTSDIRITLTDGGGCPIEGGIITFAAQIAGDIIGQNIDTTDADGHAYARFQIRGCDIQRQPDGRARIEAPVRAILAQKPTVFSVEAIICTRP